MAASRLKDVRLVHSRARIHHAGLRGATRLELIRIAASRPDDVLRLRTRGLGFDKRQLTAAREACCQVINICVWVKDNAGMGSFYRSQHEFVGVFQSGLGSHRNNVQLGRFGRNRSNVWHYAGSNSFSRAGDEGNLLAVHPTVKPAALVADAIMDCSSRNDIVLDGFLGSGTTVIAAQRTGRRCYGLEIDPLYVDAIVRRWQAFTRDTARHARTGSSFKDLETEAEERGWGEKETATTR
jgi:DNA methylase